MGRSYDAIVIGCGAMGSAASYNLASRGLKTLTLDRFTLNHEMGSSHGKSRIIRLAYYEDSRYVPLLRRAYDSWSELERASGKKLLAVTGGLMVGSGQGDLVTGVLKSAKEHGLQHRRMTGPEVEEEFPIFRVGESYEGVYEDRAGMLYPEECIAAFVALANERGGSFGFSEPVVGWDKKGDNFEVRTTKDTYQADRLVLCGGAWNGELAGEKLPLRVERQVPFWFDSGGDRAFFSSEMPVFIVEESPSVFYYGLPDVGDGVKVARTHGGKFVDPDKVQRQVTREDSAPVEGFISRRIPRLKVPAISSTTCLYTNTPDLNFVVGELPGHPGVVLVSACSGHGFKFAAVMGEVAADLTIEGRSRLDIGFLSPTRFGTTSSA